MHYTMAAVVGARRCTTPWWVVGERIKFVLIVKGAGNGTSVRSAREEVVPVGENETVKMRRYAKK